MGGGEYSILSKIISLHCEVSGSIVFHLNGEMIFNEVLQ